MHPTSEPHTGGIVCSCWPTGGDDPAGLLPTPCARDGKGAGHQVSSLPSLLHRTPELARLLPTPRARDGKGVGHDTLPGLIQPWARSQLLPTPRASDTGTPGRAAGKGFRPPLSQVLLPLAEQTLLPTPRATDGPKGCPAQRGSKGDLTLPSAAVQLLPTPTAARYGSNQSPSPGAAMRPGLDSIGQLLPAAAGSTGTPKGARDGQMWGPYQAAISRWETVVGRAAPAATQTGTTGSPVLAPALVEWMMGLPEQWVTDPQLGLARTAALRVLGNGVVPQQAIAALRILLCPHRWQAGR